jgi:hypothetical protein
MTRPALNDWWRRCATEEISKERGNEFAATKVALASMG